MSTGGPTFEECADRVAEGVRSCIKRGIPVTLTYEPEPFNLKWTRGWPSEAERDGMGPQRTD